MTKKLSLLMFLILLITLGCPSARSRTNVAKPDDTNIVDGSVTEGDITLPSSGSMDIDIEEVDRGEFAESPADATSEVSDSTSSDSTYVAPSETPSGGSSNINTYRVQVIASSTQYSADDAAGRVRSQMPSEKVFVDYVGGLYKVRVGAYSDYDSASSLRERLIMDGYSDAWVVKAGVQ